MLTMIAVRFGGGPVTEGHRGATLPPKNPFHRSVGQTHPVVALKVWVVGFLRKCK